MNTKKAWRRNVLTLLFLETFCVLTWEHQRTHQNTNRYSVRTYDFAWWWNILTIILFVQPIWQLLRVSLELVDWRFNSNFGKSLSISAAISITEAGMFQVIMHLRQIKNYIFPLLLKIYATAVIWFVVKFWISKETQQQPRFSQTVPRLFWAIWSINS